MLEVKHALLVRHDDVEQLVAVDVGHDELGSNPRVVVDLVAGPLDAAAGPRKRNFEAWGCEQEGSYEAGDPKLISVAQPSSIPGPASADFITIIVESNFRHRQDEKRLHASKVQGLAQA